MNEHLEVVIVLALSCLLLDYIFRQSKASGLRLPPGPKREPLIGNLRHFVSHSEWLAYAKMGKGCNSDIISLSALGNTIIVLNSNRAVSELLEKRAIYADRPQSPMLTDKRLMGLGDIVSFCRYGPRWRQLRKSIHQDMQESVIHRHWPSQQLEARRLIARLYDHGGNSLLKDIQHWSAGSIVLSTYGYQLPWDTSNDPLLQNLDTFLHMIASALAASRFKVNLFPILKYVPDWMPGGGFKQFARRGRELHRMTMDVPFEWVKSEIAKGTARSSFVSRQLSEGESASKNKQGQINAEHLLSNEDLVRSNASVMFGGGYDTTASTLLSFFIAMQLYPEVQSRARDEILTTVDPMTHLPNPAEVMKLDYLRRVFQEVLRWIPALALGLPHAVTVDDEYRGYQIPAGSIVIANHWSISREESIYPDPEIFNPDRFLDPTLPHETPFGHGRRRCPGMHFANSNLLIAISYILTLFEIEKARDEDGSVVTPVPLMRKDPNCRPETLRCSLKPRNPQLCKELLQEHAK